VTIRSTPLRRPSPPIGEADRAVAATWHAVWAGMVLLAGLPLALINAPHPALRLGGLAAIALPGLVGWLLLRRTRDGRPDAILVVWGLAAAAACLLSGGLAGPMAAMMLMPAAAATALGGGRRVAEGCVLVVTAGAVVALAGLSRLAAPMPDAPAAFWISLASVILVSLAMGSALLLAERRAAAREAGRRAEAAAFEALLHGSAVLLAPLDHAGVAQALFGLAPPGLDLMVLRQEGLIAAAIEPHQILVEGAIALAGLEGRSEVEFAPTGAPELTLVATLRRGEDGVIMAAFRDATADKAREAALRAQKQDAEEAAAGRSRFLAEMSHELRTPLNAIMGFSDVMRGRLFGPLSDRYTEYSQLIHESGTHLLDLINDVLDMSKIEADRYQLSLEDFDARDPVSAALRLMRVQADAAGVSLRGVLPPGPLEVRADRRALKQIALNLLANALKFTPHGGQVTVTVQASGQGSGEMLELVVADSGIGIAPADLERLGRPYEQAGDAAQNARGTGLGLSLVRAFAGLHGGELAIESVLGEGATFSVRLPVLIKAEAPLSPTAVRSLGDNVIAFNPNR
jgi:cell cycle sensor histidine kinase DivJ